MCGKVGEAGTHDPVLEGDARRNGPYVLLEGDELAALKPKASRQI